MLEVELETELFGVKVNRSLDVSHLIANAPHTLDEAGGLGAFGGLSNACFLVHDNFLVAACSLTDAQPTKLFDCSVSHGAPAALVRASTCPPALRRTNVLEKY
jgi:hypothetical protein